MNLTKDLTKRPDINCDLRCVICGSQPVKMEDGKYLCMCCRIEDQRAYLDFGTIRGLELMGELELTKIKVLAEEISRTAEFLLKEEVVFDNQIEILVKKMGKLERVGRHLLDSL